MTRSQGMSPSLAGSAPADRLAVVSLLAALIAVAILWVTFRGLVLVTLPLAAIAFALGAWGAVHATRPSARAVALIGFALGLIALIISIGALAADITVDGGYDFYERHRP